MANVASARKRVRSNEKKRLRNRYQHKTTKTHLKNILNSTERTPKTLEALNKANAMLDKLVKRGIIHPNKRNRKKAQLSRHVNQLKG